MSYPPPLIRGWRAWTLAFVFWTVVGLLMFGYQYLDIVTRNGSDPFYETLIEELTGAYATGVLALGIIAIARLLHGEGVKWVRAVVVHGAVSLLYSVIHTSMLWASRIFVWDALRLGIYDYGEMPTRYFMELPNDLLDYLILASLVHLIISYRASRNRELEVARLERELTQAQLQALQGQLRPHFLFNALNTVSSLMYRDVAAADRVLAQLADLLRSSLKSDDTQEVALQEEIATLEAYLAVMRARFDDRLTVDVTVDPAAEHALVPHLLLQPLVENALKHGVPGSGKRAHVRVLVTRSAAMVVLSVEDNGRGVPKEGIEFGVGLENTAARLEHLYPSNHILSITNGNQGFKVEVSLPFRASGVMQ